MNCQVRELPEGARVSLAQFERLAAAEPEAAGIEQGRECERRLCTPAPPREQVAGIEQSIVRQNSNDLLRQGRLEGRAGPHLLLRGRRAGQHMTARAYGVYATRARSRARCSRFHTLLHAHVHS